MAAALKKSLARNGVEPSGGGGRPSYRYGSYWLCDARTARGDQLSPVVWRVARPSGPTASSNRVVEIEEIAEIALTGRVGVGAGVSEAGSVTASRRGSNWKFIGCPMRAGWRVSSLDLT
jgi:hypothetical protein